MISSHDIEINMLFFDHDIKEKLGNIATVRSGLVLARKQARSSSGILYPLLNLRSINSGGYIDMNQTDKFEATEHLDLEYLYQIGDVIVRMTMPYTAVCIDKNTAGMVISSNFVIIRPDNSKLLPEYLYWLLNTPRVKHIIYQNASRNMLGAIHAGFFSEFEIPLLSISNQQKIATMNHLAIKEAKLLRQLANEKEKYYTYCFSTLTYKSKETNK